MAPTSGLVAGEAQGSTGRFEEGIREMRRRAFCHHHHQTGHGKVAVSYSYIGHPGPGARGQRQRRHTSNFLCPVAEKAHRTEIKRETAQHELSSRRKRKAKGADGKKKRLQTRNPLSQRGPQHDTRLPSVNVVQHRDVSEGARFERFGNLTPTIAATAERRGAPETSRLVGAPRGRRGQAIEQSRSSESPAHPFQVIPCHKSAKGMFAFFSPSFASAGYNSDPDGWACSL
ncbi:uncharacterized protein B0H64DRAFT_463875 [Chaetomium fimeti]|uniref:Uncharacterized protein n=1 Tax=Chaetomium fimeti TaxID=1854472 RepID=A0AAE0HEA6_9PEZI|nr:hypothetical protein B0H64DRAFT_463875 [Chaetomium fimeti]